jgi:hypothetical protein
VKASRVLADVVRYQRRGSGFHCASGHQPLVPRLRENNVELVCLECDHLDVLTARTYAYIQAQLDVLDRADGERLKAAGMAAADANADERWKADFDARLNLLAASGRAFTSEDVTREVGLPPSGSPNAVGARINAAARRGVIVRVGDVKAARVNQHATRISSWIGA